MVNCFRDKWYERWRKNGWRNAQKKPVDNRDLWEALLAEAERHDVTWHKVAGHSGDPLNDRADALARARHRPRRALARGQVLHSDISARGVSPIAMKMSECKT